MPWIERVRTEQPLDAGVGIDRANPLTRGMVSALHAPQGGFDAVTGERFSIVGTEPIRVSGPSGIATRFTGSNGYYKPLVHNGWPLTHFCVLQPQNLTADQVVMGGGSGSPAREYVFFIGSSAGDPFWSGVRDNSNIALSAVSGASGAAVGQSITVSSVYSSSASRSIFVGNKKVNNTTAQGATNLSRVLYGCGSTGTPAGSLVGDIFAGFVWTRELSDDEIDSLNTNPWQLFEKERIWVPVAAGGDTYTLTADSGSFALTGQDTALNFNRTLSADSGSFALTGQDAALTFNRTLAADSGSFALTGQDVTPTFNRVLSAASGSYALAGQDATLTYTPISGATYTLAAASGSFALAGQDAALVFNRVLAADSGSFALTGQDATLARGYTMPAQSGDYSVAGQDAALTASRRLAADSAAFALAGQSVTMTYSNAPPAVVAGAVVGRRMAVTGKRPDRLQTAGRPAR